jgi:DNA polymerase III alpha subunit (gram-positive type)
MNQKHIIIFDIETGGLDEKVYPIIQIAAVAVELQTMIEVEEFQVKIKFDENKAEKQALAVNSYDPVVWAKEAIEPRQAAAQFEQFVDPFKYQFVSQRGKRVSTGFACGHNSERFDIPFLHSWYKRMGAWCPIGFKNLDTLQMALIAQTLGLVDFGDKHQLKDVARTLGISLPEVMHDAMEDTRITAKVFAALMQVLKGKRS